MIAKDLPAQAANIQRATTSAATCTPATVDSLRSFLLQSERPALSSREKSVKAQVHNGRTTAKIKATVGKPKRKPEVAILEVGAEDDDDEIKAPQKVALATEVVNVTLKALNEAIKNPPLQKRRATLRRTSSNGSFSNGAGSRSQTPLQPLCVNRLSNTPGEKGVLRRSSSTASPDERLVGLRAQAECSRIAFATLRLMQGQTGSPNIPQLQLESGMSALVGRLITLGFGDLAVKELRILKRRLDSHIRATPEGKATKPTNSLAIQDKAEPKPETLEDMLCFSQLGATDQLLTLIITTQLQIIKMITLKKDPHLTQAALQHLRPDVSYSPVNMVQSQIDPESPASRNKAAQQLESLAQSLLALCPPLSSAEDAGLSKSSNKLSPDTAFEIQMTALQVRQIWWKLSGHRVDIATELVGPFHRFLSAFHRRSAIDREEKYGTAKNAFGNVADRAQDTPGFQGEAFLPVYLVLADLAQESAQYSEAIEWVKKARVCARDHALSQVRKCSLECRLASLHIRAFDLDPNEEILDALKAAISSLSGDLRGESADLDDLLVNVASLRKSAFSVYQEAQRLYDPESVQRPPLLINQCSDIILLCPRFVLRYLGSGSSQSENGKMDTRRDQRRRLAAQVSYPIIESIVAVVRFSAKVAMDGWTKLDVGLRDCCALASAVETVNFANRQASSRGTQASCPYASISNAYWARYLYLRQQPEATKPSRNCLQSSIEIIQDRGSLEQVIGLLPLKLEKYAQLCETTLDYGKATETYQRALHAQVNLGYLENARKAAEVRSLPNALDSNSELGTLARVLLAYPKAAAKATGQDCRVNPYFDIENLRADGRGVLLEQQLIALLSTYNGSASSFRYPQTLNKLAETLLSVYTQEAYPVRRLRVVVRLLRLTCLTSDIVNCELQQLLTKPSAILTEAHSDARLLQFLPHLIASQETILNLRQQDFDVKKLDVVMATWSEVLHKKPTWDLLQMQIYDLSDWLSLLELLTDYLNMRGLELTRVSVIHVMVAICETATSKECSNLVSKLSLLGLQYARLGYSGCADRVLHKAQVYWETSDVPVDIVVEWHLNYAEHALYIRNLRKCGDHLKKAQKLFDQRFTSEGFHSMGSRERSRLSLLVADAYHMYSVLAAAEGQTLEALYYARLTVKSNQRSWATLERSSGRSNKVQRTDKGTSTDASLADALSELSVGEQRLTETDETRLSDPSRAAFWSLVPRLFRGLMHLSHILAFCGVFQEVKYYMGQAQKVANVAKAPCFLGQHSSSLGKYLIHSGQLDEGLKILQDARNVLVDIPHDRHYVQLQLSLAENYIGQGRGEDGLAAVALAEQTLRDLMRTTYLDELIHQQPASDNLDLRLGTLTLQETKPKGQPPHTARRGDIRKKVTRKSNMKQTTTECLPKEIAATEAIALNRMKVEILRGRILAAMSGGSHESAITLLEEAASLSCDQQDIVLQALLASHIRFRQGVGQLVSDPVYCVLPESTISYPSIKACDKWQGQDGSPCRQQKSTRAVTTKNQRVKPSATKPRTRSPIRCKSEVTLFDIAQSSLNEIYKLAKTYSMTSIVHEVTMLLGKILILLSATSYNAPSRSVSPTFMVYILETGRLLAMTRESMVIHVEHQLSQVKIAYDWPGKDPIGEGRSYYSNHDSGFAPFQADYIDIIPSTWNVISMTLSESREEILICKIRAGQSPLVLRLPLSRPNSMENEEERFGFDEAKAELQDIVRLTNESTHGAQDLTQKGAKTKWWEARSALDVRLRDLLINIENIWLGGFRGIFSPKEHDEGLLARLQQSLQNILNKHLPSRQGSGKANQINRFTFDLHIVELFTGLGCPSETHDVDEPLMDLLYFVVDILQFNGERNAYDEIDFDSIAIETTDALRQYHQAIRDEASDKTEQHTILILDKQLHCFPWESLPSLSGQAVSRLPSLGCLRDRILMQKESKWHRDDSLTDSDRFYVNRDAGASILNPGGDLKATQSRFEETLQDLSGWDTVVERAPTEPEMKGFLESREVFLYFGHGSGSQYIRSRTIKKLETCAVALLMGCSSGAMAEAGKFESYGTPMNYMHAGSPAIVATLWDVTDKDIDKFSQTVLEEWGLFRKPQSPLSRSPTKKSAKQRGKSKINNIEEVAYGERSPVSLDMAVSRGRNSCILKYLNGAAPVVYGIPVFLS